MVVQEPTQPAVEEVSVVVVTAEVVVAVVVRIISSAKFTQPSIDTLFVKSDVSPKTS